MCLCSVGGWEGACACVTGSQLVRQLSRSDLWPRDSNLSSLPVQYCYNWQLMRPDMLSSRALNRTSIFPRHTYHFFFFFFLHTLLHTQRPPFSVLSLFSVFLRWNIWQALKKASAWQQETLLGGKRQQKKARKCHTLSQSHTHRLFNLVVSSFCSVWLVNICWYETIWNTFVLVFSKH